MVTTLLKVCTLGPLTYSSLQAAGIQVSICTEIPRISFGEDSYSGAKSNHLKWQPKIFFLVPHYKQL